MAARGKKAADTFPAEVCGVCKFCHPAQDGDEGEGYCAASPPVPLLHADDEVSWNRFGLVDYGEPACHLFQPRMHA